jgi:hypothetical protein
MPALQASHSASGLSCPPALPRALAQPDSQPLARAPTALAPTRRATRGWRWRCCRVAAAVSLLPVSLRRPSAVFRNASDRTPMDGAGDPPPCPTYVATSITADPDDTQGEQRRNRRARRETDDACRCIEKRDGRNGSRNARCTFAERYRVSCTARVCIFACNTRDIWAAAARCMWCRARHTPSLSARSEEGAMA